MPDVYAAFPLIMTWNSKAMFLPHEKRAVAVAVVNGVGEILRQLMCPPTDAPDYKHGFKAEVGMCGGTALLAVGTPLIFRVLPKFKTKVVRESELDLCYCIKEQLRNNWILSLVLYVLILSH